MRGESALSHFYRSVRCGVSCARHTRKDPRRSARRACDRIRFACRSETAESCPRRRLRADVIAQRIHDAVARVAEGTDALAGSRPIALPVVSSHQKHLTLTSSDCEQGIIARMWEFIRHQNYLSTHIRAYY